MAELVRFQRTARKTGGTLAITIPPEVQRAVGMKEGSPVEIYITEDKKIIIQVKSSKG